MMIDNFECLYDLNFGKLHFVVVEIEAVAVAAVVVSIEMWAITAMKIGYLDCKDLF
jgi:hypothetical protein